MISQPSTFVELSTGLLSGKGVIRTERRLGEFIGIFHNEQARQLLDQEQVVYRVDVHAAIPESTAGGLFFGTSFVEAGRVGNEYFMTKGHFHAKRECGEYYWGIDGKGALVLMDENRHCWVERVLPGSLHYIPGRVAHRLANIGARTLVVGACWPADAGHDYKSIAQHGFSARMCEIDGLPQLVPVSEL